VMQDIFVFEKQDSIRKERSSASSGPPASARSSRHIHMRGSTSGPRSSRTGNREGGDDDWVPFSSSCWSPGLDRGYFFVTAGRTGEGRLRNGSPCSRFGTCRRRPLEVLKKDVLSEVPLLNRLLSRSTRRPDRPAPQAGHMTIRVGSFVLLSLGLFLLGSSPGRSSTGLRHFGRRRRVLMYVPNIVVEARSAPVQAVHEPLSRGARDVRPILAGRTLVHGRIQLVAQEMPHPIGPEFSKVFEEQNLGIPLARHFSGWRSGSKRSTSSSSSPRS